MPDRSAGRAVVTQPGGFYHDGRFATLGDVVNHYDKLMKLGLTAAAEKND
jgi:cytochrome c peroxidase